MTQDLDGCREGARCCVTPDQRDIMRSGEVGEASGEFGQPGFVDVGQCQGEECPSRARAHCGQVAQVYGQNAVAYRGSGAAVREVDAVHERVYRRDEVASGGRVQQGGVIANTQADVGTLITAVAEVAINESEF